jgi:hypothetical protein
VRDRRLEELHGRGFALIGMHLHEAGERGFHQQRQRLDVQRLHQSLLAVRRVALPNPQVCLRGARSAWTAPRSAAMTGWKIASCSIPALTHTRAVLDQFGFEATEVNELFAKGIVAEG